MNFDGEGGFRRRRAKKDHLKIFPSTGLPTKIFQATRLILAHHHLTIVAWITAAKHIRTTLFTAQSVLCISNSHTNTMSNNDGDIVVVEYEALLQDPGESEAANELLEKLTAAFGTEKSLGIVAIRGVPNFLGARDQFLPMAHSLARLPHDYLENKLSDPKTLYNAGWSHGKEKLGDKPDTAKGSFYFNPLSDQPGTPELRDQFPLSYPCNVWPDEEAMPGFEANAKNLGSIMHKAVVRLSLHIDALAKKHLGDSYADNMLYDQMRATDKAKGRLLYYFPIESTKSDGLASGSPTQTVSEDSWIGWHNDSGFLTALAGDMYVNDSTGEPIDKSLIDPAAGLYAVDRSGKTVRINVPEDCMAVQIGECTQVITGGAVIATPHCVRGGGLKDNQNSVRVARISLPCFIDTGPTFHLCLPSGCSRDKAIDSGVGSDKKVPPLQDRWVDGMTFGDFLGKTFAMYYDWSKK